MADTTTKRKRRPKRNGDPHHVGRPHDLDRPVTFGGRELTASEAIIAIMRSGEPLYLAARACGLHHDTAYNWRSDGQRIASDLAEHRRELDDLTDYERAALAFSEGVSRAEAEAEALMAARLGQAAAGGTIRRRTVTEYDRNGNALTTKVTEETMPPDPKAAMFWLERRGPERWGRAQRLEHVAGDGPGTVQTDRSPLERLAEQLDAIARRRSAGAARLAAVDVDEVPPAERSA